MNPHDVQIHCCAVLGCVSVSFIGGSVPTVEEIGRDDLARSGEQYNPGPPTAPLVPTFRVVTSVLGCYANALGSLAVRWT